MPERQEIVDSEKERFQRGRRNIWHDYSDGCRCLSTYVKTSYCFKCVKFIIDHYTSREFTFYLFFKYLKKC